MSMPSRMKSGAGGDIVPDSKRTVASATALIIPDWTNVVYVSGSTTVTSISMPAQLRSRRVTFIGAASANVTFTNTDTLTTAGQMYLRGVNRQLQESTILELFCQADGTWIIVNSTTA